MEHAEARKGTGIYAKVVMQYKTDATVVDIILFSFVGMECEMEASLKGAAGMRGVAVYG